MTGTVRPAFLAIATVFLFIVVSFIVIFLFWPRLA